LKVKQIVFLASFIEQIETRIYCGIPNENSMVKNLVLHPFLTCVSSYHLCEKWISEGCFFEQEEGYESPVKNSSQFSCET